MNSPFPTGTITITDNGTLLGTRALVNGAATFAYESLFIDPSNPTGIHTITVNYPGDVNYSVSSGTVSSPTITSAATKTFGENVANAFTVTTSGNLPATYLMSGSLPSGVTFNTGTGVLSGVPAVGTYGNTYPLSYTASNGLITDATQSFTLTIGLSPAFTSASSATFEADVSGSFTVVTTGDPTPTVTMSGTLPAGVTFDARTACSTAHRRPAAVPRTLSSSTPPMVPVRMPRRLLR